MPALPVTWLEPYHQRAVLVGVPYQGSDVDVGRLPGVLHVPALASAGFQVSLLVQVVGDLDEVVARYPVVGRDLTHGGPGTRVNSHTNPLAFNRNRPTS